MSMEFHKNNRLIRRWRRAQSLNLQLLLILLLMSLRTIADITCHDIDNDGIVDSLDNCIEIVNANQRDTDGDGYGNLCDADLDGNLIVNAADFILLRNRLNTNDRDADLNGDGVVNAADYILLRNQLNQSPGPSGTRNSSRTIIDRFERNFANPWYFSNGAEFPGATGSLSMGLSELGRGAELTYDFSNGGNYVSASLDLSTPVFGKAVAFRAKSAPGIRLGLRITDDTGQTLQYTVLRPFEAMHPDGWYQQAVNLDSPRLHWGGANDGLLHGTIHSISILVDKLVTGASGVVSLDDIEVLNTLRVTLKPALEPCLPIRLGSEDLLSQLGVSIHFTQDDQALNAASTAGFSFVRTDLAWQSIEQITGVYDFSAYDQLLSSLEARNMGAMFILDYGNPIYTGGAWNTPPRSPAEINAFGNFAEAAAAHFSGNGVQYEVWNEPNLELFWSPQPNATEYARLAEQTVARVHAGESSAKVATGAVSELQAHAFISEMIANGDLSNTDAISMHLYNWDDSGQRARPEENTDHYLLMQHIVSSSGLGTNMPLWNTEWGYSAADYGDGHSSAARNRQAILVVRELLTSWGLGFPRIVYYTLRDSGDDPDDPEHNFGLLDFNYQEKPAMRAVKTLTNFAKDRQFTGFVPLQPTSLHAMQLESLDDTVLVVWSDAPGEQVSIRVPPSTTGTNYLGSTVKLTREASGLMFTLNERDGPVYLTFPAQ